MSLFEDIKDLAGGKSQNPSWWRSQFQYGLEGLTPSAEPGSTGRMLFFTYRAEYGEKYRYTIYFPSIQKIQNYNSRKLLELYSKHEFKIYMFQEENEISQKIKLELKQES